MWDGTVNEVLLNTSRISDLILKGDIQEIKEVMERSENVGMRTFDAALFYLYKEGKITLEEALKNADGENNLRLRIDLDAKGQSTAEAEDDGFAGLSLLETEEEDDEEELQQNGMSSFQTPG